ncbi:MAG TPA: ATP12 family protein [Novosphingobium sp.]|nr:ATP12 family protein [Novosphingobium sp.]
MKRFYKTALAEPVAGGWQVTLDGRGVKTPLGRPQIVPTEALAEALAGEWAAQGAEIDPATLMLRDLADFALDVVAPDRSATISALLRYAETDTLCYRAEPEEPLHPHQLAAWEPLLTAAEARWDIHFKRVNGILHRPQPAATLARFAAVLGAEDDVALAALMTLTSLAASLVVGLAALAPDSDPVTLWALANLEEDWQAELWGNDAEALELRAKRLATFTAAHRFARS